MVKYPHVIANVGLEATIKKPNVYDVVNVTRRALARRGWTREALDFETEALNAAQTGGWRAAYDVACRWCTVLVPTGWLA